MTTKTGTDTFTEYFEDGERVYPCVCGETHRGENAINEWLHHNCFHLNDLIGFAVDEKTYQVLCPQCGMSWIMDIVDREIPKGDGILYIAKDY